MFQSEGVGHAQHYRVNDSISALSLPFTDVPAPPERPLITYFTSRLVNLSWAHMQDSRNDPVIDFIIEIR